MFVRTVVNYIRLTGVHNVVGNNAIIIVDNCYDFHLTVIGSNNLINVKNSLLGITMHGHGNTTIAQNSKGNFIRIGTLNKFY